MFPAGLAVHERGPDRIAFLPGSHAGETLRAFDRRRQVFARELVQGGFVVEEVDVGHAAGLEETEDPLRLGGEVRKARQSAFTCLRSGGKKLGEEHRAEGQPADPPGGLPDEGTAREMVQEIVLRVHGFSSGSRFR